MSDRRLVIPDKLNKSGLDFAHCILFVIYQCVEVEALVVAAGQLHEIPALDAVLRDGRGEHVGIRDLLQQRHLRQ